MEHHSGDETGEYRDFQKKRLSWKPGKKKGGRREKKRGQGSLNNNRASNGTKTRSEEWSVNNEKNHGFAHTWNFPTCIENRRSHCRLEGREKLGSPFGCNKLLSQRAKTKLVTL